MVHARSYSRRSTLSKSMPFRIVKDMWRAWKVSSTFLQSCFSILICWSFMHRIWSHFQFYEFVASFECLNFLRIQSGWELFWLRSVKQLPGLVFCVLFSQWRQSCLQFVFITWRKVFPTQLLRIYRWLYGTLSSQAQHWGKYRVMMVVLLRYSVFLSRQSLKSWYRR